MRLVCPSCKANYEVPRTAVPIGGREVQCASCGHKWFQTRTKKTTDAKPTQLDSKSSEENNIELENNASAQRKIDPSVIKILKEEAKREIEARDRERSNKNNPSEKKKTEKSLENNNPEILTKDAILKHQSKDIIAEALDEKKRSQFPGFILGLLVVLASFLVYSFSAELTLLLPEAESYIIAYVQLIDWIRLELNKLAGKTIYLINSFV
ncbi:MAG: zinc-ribbon domain-containing protein [Paracoccaceae bacterium]